MEVFILYWIFSTLFCVGIYLYDNDLKFANLIICILLGWVIMPTTLGSARAKSLDDERRN